MKNGSMERHLRRVDEAVAEAKRFLSRAEAWRNAPVGDMLCSKENAAMKRASMDLTRALVEVRRSPYEE